MSAPQPLTDDELAAIKARAKDASAAIFAGDLFVIQRGAAAWLAREDVPRLVAEVERLRAKVERVEALHASNGARVEKCLEDGNLWPCPTIADAMTP